MTWTVDAAIAPLARKQHGVFTRQQALASGISSKQIERRVADGAWIRRTDGVYQLPTATPGWVLELQAGLLAHGPECVVSHRAAARLHHWAQYTADVVELTAPGAPNYRTLGTVHRTKDLYWEDLTEVDGFPATNELRTVIDLSSQLGLRRLEWLVDDLLASKAFTLEQLADRFVRIARRGKPGTANLRKIIRARGPGYVAPASRLEGLLIDVLTAAGLPAPVRQAMLPSRVGPGRVDLAYVGARLIIEADSRRWHTRAADFELDRQRDNEATALGWSIVRITWKQLVEHPEEVVALVRECLRRAA